MKEFIKDSPELKEFELQLQHIDDVPFTYRGDPNDYEVEKVFYHKQTGKLYRAYCSEHGFQYFRISIVAGSPYIVQFFEVKKIDRMITDYEDVDEINFVA
jgi:hypothetical protein